MKELKPYIRERRLNEVIRALRTAGARAVTVVKTVPMGAEVEPEYVDVSRAVPVEHLQEHRAADTGRSRAEPAGALEARGVLA